MLYGLGSRSERWAALRDWAGRQGVHLGRGEQNHVCHPRSANSPFGVYWKLTTYIVYAASWANINICLSEQLIKASDKFDSF